jgi:hypothetical protein
VSGLPASTESSFVATSSAERPPKRLTEEMVRAERIAAQEARPGAERRD